MPNATQSEVVTTVPANKDEATKKVAKPFGGGMLQAALDEGAFQKEEDFAMGLKSSSGAQAQSRNIKAIPGNLEEVKAAFTALPGEKGHGVKVRKAKTVYEHAGQDIEVTYKVNVENPNAVLTALNDSFGI